LSRFDPMPLDDQQVRYLHGAAKAWRRFLAAQDERSAVDGALAWKTSKGREYLVHSWYDSETGTKRSRSLGPRSLKTEGEKLEFDHRRRRADEALAAAKAPLDRLSRVAKALRLGRMDNTAAGILRELRRERVLGPELYATDYSVVAGYEAQAGVFLPRGLGEEPDRLELCMTAEVDDALLDDLAKACRRMDSSFRRATDATKVVSDRFTVTLFSRRATLNWLRRSGEFDRDQLDVLAGAIEARPIRTVAIAKNGMPVEIVGPDPRNFALLHYASKIAGIEPGQNRAFAVGRLVEKHWPDKFSPRVAEAFPEFAKNVGIASPAADDPDLPDPEEPRFFGP